MRVELETMDQAVRRSYSVILGLGYVGLPLAQQAVASGLNVVGLDLSERVVGLLNDGCSHIDDVSDADVAAMRERGFYATTDPSVIADATEVIICVPTPLSDDGGPDLGAVRSAGRRDRRPVEATDLGGAGVHDLPGHHRGDPPTDARARSGLVAGRDFFLAFSPGADRPGQPDVRRAQHAQGRRRVTTAECTERGQRVLRALRRQGRAGAGARARPRWPSCWRTPTAMSTSPWSTRWRSSATSSDIDLWDVIALRRDQAVRVPGVLPGPRRRRPLHPDRPELPLHRVRPQLGHPFRFVELAQEINASMPALRSPAGPGPAQRGRDRDERVRRSCCSA